MDKLKQLYERYQRFTLPTRLLWIFLLMAVVFVVLVGGSMSAIVKRGFEDNLRPHLARYLEYVKADIGTPPDIDKARALANRVPIEIHIYTPDQVWSSRGRAPRLDRIEYEHAFVQDGERYLVGDYRDRNYLISPQGEYNVLFAIPRIQRPYQWRLLVPILFLLASLFILHFIIRRLLSPIGSLKAGVRRIGDGELDHRINLNRKDELGELADSVNSMAGDIEQMLDSKRQLLLAISHELRSPLTRAKLSVAMLESDKQQQEINQDLNEMEALIQELLETERLSGRHSKLNQSVVSINSLVSSLISELFDGKVQLTLLAQDSDMSLDATRIRLLLKNLIDNALKHSEGQQMPQVTLLAQPTGLLIQVQDFGAGIDAADIPHLTEPFYRADPSRQRGTGGYGLGLYLCRVIAEAHGGQLMISSELGQGTLVSVLLPG